MLAQLEILHRGRRHQLYRGSREGRKLVVKQLGSAERDALFVAESFNQGLDSVSALARLVMTKTDGNPFWAQTKKAVRGPKVIRKRTRFLNTPHGSIARLLGKA